MRAPAEGRYLYGAQAREGFGHRTALPHARSDVKAVRCLGCESPGISHNAKELEVHFEIYKDKAGEFRFRITATNGNVFAASEGYKQKASAINAIERIMSDAAGAATIDNS